MLSPLSDAWPRFDAEWSYDTNLGRYRRPSGQFMSQKAVMALVDGRIDKLGQQLRRFTQMLADGNITIDQWQGSVREAIKAAHIQATVLGHGGKDGMGSAEYGRIGQRLRAEYTYLQKFAGDILAGRVSTPMALARVQLYAESVRGSYWEGSTIRQERQGYSLMRRILDPQAQHCDDCVRYAGAGLVSLGSLPMPGQRCECRSRCRCTVEYKRNAVPTVPV
ncbi:MAG: hypothetical protein ACO3HP_03830 [Candidatus Nanopelagicaceae bacterium]